MRLPIVRIGLVPSGELSKQAYVNAMSMLSDDKQDLDQLGRDIEVLEHWLPDLKPVRPKVKSMEDSLRPLESEWESVASTPDDEFQPELLKELRRFQAKRSDAESDFRRFRAPYYNARSHLMTLLANTRTRFDQPNSR